MFNHMSANELTSTSDSDDSFARSVKAVRERKDLTQEDLAKSMRLRGFDFHQQTVYKIERGKRKVTVGEGVALAEILDEPFSVLAGIDPDSLEHLQSGTRQAGFEFYLQLFEAGVAVRRALAFREQLNTAIGRLEDFASDPVLNVPYGRDTFELLLDFDGLDRFRASWKTVAKTPGFEGTLRGIGFTQEEIDEGLRLFS